MIFFYIVKRRFKLFLILIQRMLTRNQYVFPSRFTTLVHAGTVLYKDPIARGAHREVIVHRLMVPLNPFYPIQSLYICISLVALQLYCIFIFVLSFRCFVQADLLMYLMTYNSRDFSQWWLQAARWLFSQCKTLLQNINNDSSRQRRVFRCKC